MDWPYNLTAVIVEDATMANYWIFQANPEKYFILQYWLRDYYLRKLPADSCWWGVEKEFSGAFTKEDVAFIWKCREDPPPDKLEYYEWIRDKGWKGRGRGIYAVARVIGPASWGKPKFTDADKKYYVDCDKAQEEQWLVYFEFPEDGEWMKKRHLLLSPLLWNGKLSERSDLRDLRDNFARPGLGAGKLAFRLKPHEGRILWELVFRNGPPPPF